MATWPATLPDCQSSVGYGGDSIMPTVRTPFDAGYVQTWPLFTKKRRVFRCGWMALSETHFNTFMTFFETTAKGGSESFTWADNEQSTPVNYTVRFRQDAITWERVANEKYKVTFELEEV